MIRHSQLDERVLLLGMLLQGVREEEKDTHAELSNYLLHTS